MMSRGLYLSLNSSRYTCKFCLLPSTTNLDTFSSIYGFICGLVSENYDIEKIFIDGLDKIINPLSADLISFIDGIDKLSDKHEFEIIISASIYDQDVLEKVQKYSHNYEKVSL